MPANSFAWTPKRVELLLEMRANGMTATQIALEFADGVTRNMICGKLARLSKGGSDTARGIADPGRVNQRRTDVWTEEHVSTLREMYANGALPFQVGAVIGRTSNAVQFKARQLGIKRVINGENLSAQYLAAAKARSKKSDAPPIPVSKITGASLKPVDSGKTLVDLADNECHFPGGDPIKEFENFRYCGAPVCGDGESYCAHHRRLVYIPYGEYRKVSARIEKLLLSTR